MAKYLKRDSEIGFIEDSVEIQSLQFNNARHSVLSCMLGDFDEFGNYVVHPEIVKELIEIPKFIVDTIENIEICHSAIKFDKQISFMAVFEGNKATLSLIEKINYEANHKINGGTWSNINEYVLDEVETSGEINRNSLYLKWNIQRFSGEVIDIFNCDENVLVKYFGLVKRFKNNLQANTILLEKEEELEEVEAEYFIELYELLKNYPELKKAVDKQIKQNFTEKKDFILLDKPNFAKTVNEVVEKAINDNINLLPTEKAKEFAVEKRNIVINTNIKKRSIIDLVGEKTDIVRPEVNKSEANKEDLKEVKIVKLDTPDVKYESLADVGKKFVEANAKAIKRNAIIAEKMLSGTSNSKVVKVIGEILKTGVKVKDIASAVILTAVENKKEMQKSNNATSEANAQQDVKKSEPKKEAKKAEKGATKKQDKKAKAKPKKAENKKSENAAKKPEPKKTEKVEGFVVIAGGIGSHSGKQTTNESTDSKNSLTPVKPDDENLVGKTGRRKTQRIKEQQDSLTVRQEYIQYQQQAEAKAEQEKLKQTFKAERSEQEKEVQEEEIKVPQKDNSQLQTIDKLIDENTIAESVKTKANGKKSNRRKIEPHIEEVIKIDDMI